MSVKALKILCAILFGGIYKRIKANAALAYYRSKGLCFGSSFFVGDDVIIDPSHMWHIKIGDNVTLSPRVHILAHDSSTKRALGYTRVAKVIIGNSVFVGASSIILPGVSIGDDVIIGAGSVVCSSIPSGCVYAGNPARFICSYDSYVQRKKDEFSRSPVFSSEYTLRKGITKDSMARMNSLMNSGVGYVE